MAVEPLTWPEPASISDHFIRIEKLENELLRKAAATVKIDSSISHADNFVFGAFRRTLAQSRGFRDLIAAKNFPCAAVILRAQIDTAMRVNALLLIGDREAFCAGIFDGKRFNVQKDTNGEKLTDAHLRKKLAEQHPWVDEVYRQASDFVHLSGMHFYNSIASMDDDTRIMRLVISGTDPPRPDSVYFEILDVFFRVLKLIADLLLGYLEARRRLCGT